MTASRDRPRSIDLDVLEQAADWFATLQDESADRDDYRQWQGWLQRSEDHRRAWALVESIDHQFRNLPARPATAALGTAGRSRRRLLKGLAGLAVAGPLAWTAWRFGPLDTWGADYRTAVGEIREIRLEDGTRVWLNTASALRVSFSPDQRRLTLVAGEILVDTAPDSRPLVAETTAGSARPLGTRFSLHERVTATAVTVETGRVALTPARRTDPTVIEAGQTTTFDREGVMPPRSAPADQWAWRNGTLVADNLPLCSFLEELSRYRHGVIRCDTAVADLRLVGAYPLDDTDRVLKALEDTLPVAVFRLTPWWVRVAPRDA